MKYEVLDPAMVEQHHTPTIHWIMMSIPTGDNPYGGATGDYGITWGMMEDGASRTDIMDSIYARMKDRIYALRYPNRLAEAALRKNSAFIGDGTFGMTEMLDDGPVRENAVSSFVLEGRAHYGAYGALTTGIWLAQLTLALAACVRDIRRRDVSGAMLYVAFFGATLFLMLWEARSRYLFGFVPGAASARCARRDRQEGGYAVKNKTGVCRALLLVGMGLMIPCYLFTAGNTLLSPWPLYDRNRLALCLLTPLCLLLLLLLGRAAKAKVFETHERAVLLGFAAFYFVIQLVMASALRFTPVTDLEQCVTAARRLAQTGAFGDSERSLIYFGRYPHNMGLVYLLAGIFKAADALGADELMAAALVCGLLFSMGLLCAARLCRRLGGAQAQARALLLFATCLPFLYCTSELYTDAFSVAFAPMIVFAFLKARDAGSRKERALWALLFAVCTFFGAQIRFPTIIAAIACLIAALFEKRAKLTALLAAPLALVFAVGGSAVNAANKTNLGAANIAQNKLPKLHYIAMGLPVQSDEGYGQYGYGGWLIFSTSFDDPQARDEALRQEVVDRAYTLARHPGSAAQHAEPKKPFHLRTRHIQSERNL